MEQPIGGGDAHRHVVCANPFEYLLSGAVWVGGDRRGVSGIAQKGFDRQAVARSDRHPHQCGDHNSDDR